MWLVFKLLFKFDLINQSLSTASVSKPPPPELHYANINSLLLCCHPADAYATYTAVEFEIQYALCPTEDLLNHRDAFVWFDAQYREHTLTGN